MLSLLSCGEGGEDAKRGGRLGCGQGIVRGDFSGEGDVALEDARGKLCAALKLGTAGEISPRRMFEYLDPDGIGEVEGPFTSRFFLQRIDYPENILISTV